MFLTPMFLGFDLAVRWLGGHDYEARWYNPPTDGAAYRLRIALREKQSALRVELTAEA